MKQLYTIHSYNYFGILGQGFRTKNKTKNQMLKAVFLPIFDTGFFIRSKC